MTALPANFLQYPTVRYLLPFGIFMILTELQRSVSGPLLFWLYGIKSVAVGFLLWIFFHRRKAEIPGKWDGSAVAIGVLTAVLWIFSFLFFKPQTPASFDPSTFSSTLGQTAAILCRTAGAVLVVPVMEELVWRSFLMRYLIRKDFSNVALGVYTPFSFWLTVLAFTLVHKIWEWPAAFLTGILYGFYLVKTKNLAGCITAHAAANLSLAVYTVLTKTWQLW